MRRRRPPCGIAARHDVTPAIFPANNEAHLARLAKAILPSGRELADSLYNASPFDTIPKK